MLAKSADLPAGGAGFRDGQPRVPARQLRSVPTEHIRIRFVARWQVKRREHVTLKVLPAQRMSLARQV